jgi:hypothetical protein
LGGAWVLRTGDETYVWNLHVMLERGQVQMTKTEFDDLSPDLLHDLDLFAALDERYRVMARKGLLEQDAWLERVRSSMRGK